MTCRTLKGRQHDVFNNEKAAFLGLSAVNAMELLIGNFSSDAQFFRPHAPDGTFRPDEQR